MDLYVSIWFAYYEREDTRKLKLGGNRIKNIITAGFKLGKYKLDVPSNCWGQANCDPNFVTKESDL